MRFRLEACVNITNGAVSRRKGYSEYHALTHPLLAERIVKCGFSWPGMLIGPAWLLIRKLWWVSLILLAFGLLIYGGLSAFYQPIDAFFFGETHGDLIRDSGNREIMSQFGINEHYVSSGTARRREYADLLVAVVVNLSVAFLGWRWWERDLIARGYSVSRVVEARTLDEARAILARADFVQTIRET
jgi:hypothetical protein